MKNRTRRRVLLAQRNELAEIVFSRFRIQEWRTVPDHLRGPWYSVANSILEAGYRRPLHESAETLVDRYRGESEPVATNPVLRGVDLAMDRLVREDCFTERTLRVLDELRAEVLGVTTPDEVRAHYPDDLSSGGVS